MLPKLKFFLKVCGAVPPVDTKVHGGWNPLQDGIEHRIQWTRTSVYSQAWSESPLCDLSLFESTDVTSRNAGPAIYLLRKGLLTIRPTQFKSLNDLFKEQLYNELSKTCQTVIIECKAVIDRS